MPSAMLVALLLLLPGTIGEVLFYDKIQGWVGAENYTYYSLYQEGGATLHLRTLTGDADLYVGSRQPTYHPENHYLHSATCGTDSLRVPAGTERPLVIGVYGHPSHSVSSYELEVTVDDDRDEQEGLERGGEDEGDASWISPSKQPSVPKLKTPVKPDEEESIIWTVLFSILKVLLEVITS